MQNDTYTATRWERWEAIDTTWVFRIYAGIAVLSGAALIAWGGAKPDILPWSNAVIHRVLGAHIMMAGCCAAAFANVENPTTRRKALLLFTIGHAIVGFVIALQTPSGNNLLSVIAFLFLFTSCALFYIWGNVSGPIYARPLLSLFAGAGPAGLVPER